MAVWRQIVINFNCYNLFFCAKAPLFGTLFVVHIVYDGSYNVTDGA